MGTRGDSWGRAATNGDAWVVRRRLATYENASSGARRRMEHGALAALFPPWKGGLEGGIAYRAWSGEKLEREGA
ncbi:unnamed protein product [Closterium sp. NIES-54]